MRPPALTGEVFSRPCEMRGVFLFFVDGANVMLQIIFVSKRFFAVLTDHGDITTRGTSRRLVQGQVIERPSHSDKHNGEKTGEN